jgi:hypothetical protein
MVAGIIGVGVGVGFTRTPLSQTNFLPLLTQVNVLFPTTDLMPTLVHLAPALVVAFAGFSERDIESESIDKNAISLLLRVF